MTSSRSQIVTLEQQLAAQRGVLRRRLGSIRQEVRRGATAPGTLLCAVGVGVVLERGTRDSGRSLSGLWRAATVTTALAHSMRDLLVAFDATQPG
jgi:hypothetical protein